MQGSQEIHDCYIGLGSNLGDSRRFLGSALSSIEKLNGAIDLCCSSYYGSKPYGPVEQPDFVNAVARLKTTIPPYDLLSQLQSIENEHQRKREVRWGARTLDLDILLYSHYEILTTDLVIPHPEMLNRSFVLIPLYEISPNLIFPNGEPLSKYVQSIRDDDLWILE